MSRCNCKTSIPKKAVSVIATKATTPTKVIKAAKAPKAPIKESIKAIPKKEPTLLLTPSITLIPAPVIKATKKKKKS
jgi:hypothetical protein